MEKEKIIDGLQDLIEDRKSFLDLNSKFDDNNQFLEDIKILEEAIKLIKNIK